MKPKPKPLLLSEDEWLAVYYAVADYADGNNGNQRLRNSFLEKIGEHGEIAIRQGVAPVGRKRK